jgi:hypothetical protein
MTAFSISVNYDFINDQTSINEIENLCGEKSLFAQFKGYFQIRKIMRLSNKAIAFNSEFVNQIYKFEYDDVVEYQDILASTLKNIESLHQRCGDCTDTVCRNEIDSKFYTPFIKSIKDTYDAINKSFYFNGRHLFSEEEFNKRSEIFATFSDIWDYESSKEEKRLVFEHNAEL